MRNGIRIKIAHRFWSYQQIACAMEAFCAHQRTSSYDATATGMTTQSKIPRTSRTRNQHTPAKNLTYILRSCSQSIRQQFWRGLYSSGDTFEIQRT